MLEKTCLPDESSVRRLNLILLVLAVLFLVWMLDQVGWANLGRQFLQVGYYWPLLLVPYGVVNYLGAVSWNYLLLAENTRPSLARLFCLRLAGESLNLLTPTASMGGEPFKAYRLEAGGVPWEEAAASVVIQKGIAVLSLVLYIFFGLSLTPLLLPNAAAHLGSLGVGAGVLGGLALTFVVVQRQSPCVSVIRALDRFRLCPGSLKAKEKECALLDAQLSEFYRDHRGRCLLALLLLLLSWPVHAAEVYLFFNLIGHPVSWSLALCLDALAVLFAALGFMIPVSAGVQDGGTILLSLGFNLGATLGAALTIVRRLREAFWLSLGLLVVARENQAKPQASSAEAPGAISSGNPLS
jgi:glycosyltransferase 2 family protein